MNKYIKIITCPFVFRIEWNSDTGIPVSGLWGCRCDRTVRKWTVGSGITWSLMFVSNGEKRLTVKASESSPLLLSWTELCSSVQTPGVSSGGSRCPYGSRNSVVTNWRHASFGDVQEEISSQSAPPSPAGCLSPTLVLSLTRLRRDG